MKVKKNNLYISLFLIFISFSILLLRISLNKETILDEVKLKENKASKNSFAVMIQKEDKTGYEASTSNTWPTNMVYNNELSGCIDNYGNIIENSLSYNQETNKVTINTGVTSSCYLYFDLDKEAPIVSATVNNNNSTNATMTINSNETGTYCVNTSSTITDMSNCTFTGNITKDISVTTSIFSTEGDYYVHVKDNAGNIGISSKVIVTLVQEIGEYLLQNPSVGLNTTTAYSGMYRYTGTNANNYVKLGDVLYRIIGITTTTTNNTSLGIDAGQIKLIKATSIGNYNWHSNRLSPTTWNTGAIGTTVAAMYTYLQNNVLGNSSYIPNSWLSKLDNIKWYAGDIYTSASTLTNAEIVIGYEDNAITINQSKIGLMYVSDYFYAYIDGGTKNCSIAPYCISWMTDTTNPTWTMIRYGVNNGEYNAWFIDNRGFVAIGYQENLFAVRPVFYLNKDVYITNPTATGTSSDPFILSY